MTDINQFHDSLNVEQPPSKKIPDMLNVLTILSYIGCAMGLLGSIYNYFTVCKSVEMIEKMSESDNPMAGMMSSMTESAIKQCDMRMPIMIIGLLATVACFIGVMQMRKLKKSGFFLYLIGELAAPVAMLVMIGGGIMGGFMMLSMIIPVVFVILYATQLKHMK
jgi:hypothetical protein